jgi:hypothetical protein
VNTDFFTTSACNTSTNTACKGWEQFCLREQHYRPPRLHPILVDRLWYQLPYEFPGVCRLGAP